MKKLNVWLAVTGEAKIQPLLKGYGIDLGPFPRKLDEHGQIIPDWDDAFFPWMQKIHRALGALPVQKALDDVQEKILKYVGVDIVERHDDGFSAKTPFGVYDFDLLGLDLVYTPLSLEDTPDDAIFGVCLTGDLGSPVALDWMNRTGGLTRFTFNDAMSAFLAVARARIKGVIPWIDIAPLTILQDTDD